MKTTKLLFISLLFFLSNISYSQTETDILLELKYNEETKKFEVTEKTFSHKHKNLPVSKGENKDYKLKRNLDKHQITTPKPKKETKKKPDDMPLYLKLIIAIIILLIAIPSIWAFIQEFKRKLSQ